MDCINSGRSVNTGEAMSSARERQRRIWAHDHEAVATRSAGGCGATLLGHPRNRRRTKMETIAKYAALASSAFIFIPAGRDMISYGTFLLPGEENIRPLMTMSGESARTWMWGMWGFNHCVICLVKILAVLGGDKTMLKLMAANAAGLAAYCVLGQQAHGDMEGFIVISAVQTLSLGYLGFVAASGKSKKK